MLDVPGEQMAELLSLGLQVALVLDAAADVLRAGERRQGTAEKPGGGGSWPLPWTSFSSIRSS